LILLITSDGCIRRTLKSTKVGKFRVSLNVVNLSMQASISTDLPCSSVDNALGRHVQWSVTYCVGFKARSGPIWSFIRSFRGQGSSLLWTPALRPYVGPMRQSSRGGKLVCVCVTCRVKEGKVGVNSLSGISIACPL